jgi:hypothetical protein
VVIRLAWWWHARTGAGDEVIMSIAARLARHAFPLLPTCLGAKRRAFDEIAARQRAAEAERQKQSASAPQSALLQ